MLKRLGPLPRFVLGKAGILLLLAVTAGLWWWLPAWPRAVLFSSGAKVQDLYVSTDARTLLAHYEQWLESWDLDTKRVRAATVFPPSSQRFNIQFAPDGRKVACFNEGGPPPWVVSLWNPDIQMEPRVLENRNLMRLVGFTADSSTVITWDGNLWDTATFAPHPRPDELPYEAFRCIRQTSDGRILAVLESPLLAPPQQFLRVWELNRGVELCQVPHANNATISPDGGILAVEQLDRVLLIDLATGRELGHCPRKKSTSRYTPKFSPDGRYLCLPEDERSSIRDRFFGVVSVWDLKAFPPRKVAEVAGHVSFAPDGTCLAVSPSLTAERYHGWTLLSTATGEPLLNLRDNSGLTHEPIVFGADGRTFAAMAHFDKSENSWLEDWLPMFAPVKPVQGVCVWDRDNGSRLATFPEATVFGYFPDGRSIAVNNNKLGTVEIWDLPPRRPWWINYGLPVVVTLLVLLGVRLVWLAIRRPAPQEARPC